MTSRVAKVLVLVTFLVVACTRNSPTVSHPTPSIQAGKITWADCGGGFQCGTLQVPLDYAHPTARMITLALIRKPATDKSTRIGSVLMNPGGPGESGIEFLRGEATGHSLDILNHRFDLVTWDPRGVAESTPITCVDGSQEDQYLSTDSVLDDPQEKQAFIKANQDFAAGCKQRSGDLLPFMDSASTAQDMDQIRIAVGDEKLTFLGFSYGTYIGQWYAHLFPTRVRALSLDGVVDPTVSANDSLYGQVVGFEQNLQAFIADCKTRSSCAEGRSGNLAAKIAADMAQLDKNPLKVGNRELTRPLAMTGMLVTLYDQSTWTYLDQGLIGLEGGNGQTLLLLADIYNHRNPDGTYKNLFNGAFHSAYCMDFPVPADVAAYDALTQKFTQASALFGPWSIYSNLQCAYWPSKPRHGQEPLTVQGAAPILLVGGTNDPATPYSEAQSVNKQIQGSVLLTRQGNGHTSYDSSTCAHQAEDAYLIDLTLPAAGTVCTS